MLKAHRTRWWKPAPRVIRCKYCGMRFQVHQSAGASLVTLAGMLAVLASAKTMATWPSPLIAASAVAIVGVVAVATRKIIPLDEAPVDQAEDAPPDGAH
ncbi:MAG TPA: hypothetical protein VF193_07905 [Steroidobacter sp.]